MILIQNFYYNKNREKEFSYCLDKNIANKYINIIALVIYENDIISQEYINENYAQYDKVDVIFTPYERPTFNELFVIANGYGLKNDQIILANLDIFFDNTLEKLKSSNVLDENVICLTRWEFNGNNISKYIGWDYSQDVWMWKTPLNTQNMDCDFELGKPGCDNRIAYEFSKDYNVINPCKTIRANHYHVSQYRTYIPGDMKETIPEPYLRVTPTYLKEHI